MYRIDIYINSVHYSRIMAFDSEHSVQKPVAHCPIALCIVKLWGAQIYYIHYEIHSSFGQTGKM